MNINNKNEIGLVGKTVELSTQELVELSDLRDVFVDAMDKIGTGHGQKKFNRRIEFESNEQLDVFLSRVDNVITFLAQITEGVYSTQEVRTALFGESILEEKHTPLTTAQEIDADEREQS